jgi:hypothetical protein
MVQRNDADIMVMSNKYLDEVRLLPNTILSSVQAQVKVWPSASSHRQLSN